MTELTFFIETLSLLPLLSINLSDLCVFSSAVCGAERADCGEGS